MVTELIQNDLSVKNLLKELNTILHDEIHLQQLRADYDELRNKLAQGGNASARAAREIVQFLQPSASQIV